MSVLALVDGREHGVGADGALEKLVHAGRRWPSGGTHDSTYSAGRAPAPAAAPCIHLREGPPAAAAAAGSGEVDGVERDTMVVVVPVDVIHVHGGVREG